MQVRGQRVAALVGSGAARSQSVAQAGLVAKNKTTTEPHNQRIDFSRTILKRDGFDSIRPERLRQSARTVTSLQCPRRLDCANTHADLNAWRIQAGTGAFNAVSTIWDCTAASAWLNAAITLGTSLRAA